MKEFTKSSLALLRSELNKALSSFPKDHNIKIDLGNIRYEADHCSIKVDCYIMNNDPNFDPLKEKLRSDYKRYHESFILPSDLLDKEFIFEGKKFTLIGLDIKKRAYPIILEVEDNFNTSRATYRRIKVTVEYFKKIINQ